MFFFFFILSAFLPILAVSSRAATEGVGYLELELKSAFPLNITIEVAEGIYFPSHKQTFEMLLKPGMTGKLSNVPVVFHRPGIVLIRTGPVEKFGLDHATLRVERWNTQRMVVHPEKITLPFSGFKMSIKCERNWHGRGCSKFCNENIALMLEKRCTDEGELGCPHGFRGVDCKTPLLNSDPACQCKNNGSCVSKFGRYMANETFVCECPLMFEGAKCEKESYNYVTPIHNVLFGDAPKFKLLTQFMNDGSVDNEVP